jgi:hypothetical protein
MLSELEELVGRQEVAPGRFESQIELKRELVLSPGALASGLLRLSAF